MVFIAPPPSSEASATAIAGNEVFPFASQGESTEPGDSHPEDFLEGPAGEGETAGTLPAPAFPACFGGTEPGMELTTLLPESEAEEQADGDLSTTGLEDCARG